MLSKKDYKNAKIKFEQATLNKECKGMFNLALMYINAHGVKQNYKEAMKYFKESLKYNCLNSAYDIGAIYRNGVITSYSIHYMKLYDFSAPFATYEQRFGPVLINAGLKYLWLSSPKLISYNTSYNFV